MELREQGKIAVRKVSTINFHTRYLAANNQLFVKAPDGLTEEQKKIIRNNKDAIINYLTTPPDNEHKWEISFYGVWLAMENRQLRQEQLL